MKGADDQKLKIFPLVTQNETCFEFDEILQSFERDYVQALRFMKVGALGSWGPHYYG
jgi:hypothetical protein